MLQFGLTTSLEVLHASICGEAFQVCKKNIKDVSHVCNFMTTASVAPENIHTQTTGAKVLLTVQLIK